MGKNQSKVLNSLGVNLNKRESSRDTAELSLMRGRSTSLESVSTALSLGPRPPSHTHCRSVDDLQSPELTSAYHHQCSSTASDAVNVSDGQGLVDSGVSSSTYPTEEEGGESPQRGFTQSLPAEIERKITTRSKVRAGGRDIDGFSDNFVNDGSGDMLREIDDDSHLGSAPPSEVHQDCTMELPSIPSSLLQKLSTEELTEFITFVCATLGNSLQASLNETRDNLLNKTHSTEENNSSSKNVPSRHAAVSDTAKRGSGCGHHPSHTRRHHHHHCRSKQSHRENCDDDFHTRNERPSSIPSLHLKDNPELIERLRLISGGADPEEHASPREGRSRSKSQDDGYHDDWQRSGRSGHRSTRRRRRGEGRIQRERCGRVDVSLDDNCPGLPQNRVGRRGNRHQPQQPAVCEVCLERLGDSGNSHHGSPPSGNSHHGSPPSRRQRHRQLQSANGDAIISSSGQLGGPTQNVDESFMTLEDLKLMTSEFLKGTNDLDESVIQDLKMQFITGMAEQMKQNGKNVKRCSGNVRLDAIQPFLSRNRPKTKAFHLAEPSNSQCGNWQQLVFPRETRTGLDSPRTDMAVFNLDMNNDRMCHSIILSDHSTFNERAAAMETASRGGLYLHKHHHIHHIIHHSQP